MSKLRRDVVANTGGGIFVLVGQLASLPLALHATSVSDYGVWLAVVALANLFGLMDLGLGVALIRFAAPSVSAGKANPVVAFTRHNHAALAVAIIGAQAVGATIIVDVAGDGQSNPERVAMVAFSALAAGVLLFTRHWQAFNQSRAQFGRERLHQIAGLMVRLAGLVICIAVGGDLVHVVLVESVALIVPGTISATRLLTSRQYPWTQELPACPAQREVVIFARSWFLIAGATNFAVAAPTIVASLAGSSSLAAAVGAGVRLTSAFRQILTWSLEPTFPHSVGAGTDAMDRLVVRSIMLAWLLGVATIGGFALVGPEFLQLWLGGADQELAVTSFGYCVALMAVTVISFVPNCFSVVRQATHRPDVFRWEIVIWALVSPVCFGLCLALQPAWAASALVLAALVPFAAAYVRILRALPTDARRVLVRGCVAGTVVTTVSAVVALEAGRLFESQTETLTEAGSRALVYVTLLGAAGVIVLRRARRPAFMRHEFDE